MTCCGGERFKEVTSHDDDIEIYMCLECGKTGSEHVFPDQPQRPSAHKRRWRDTVAGWLYRIAEKISQ